MFPDRLREADPECPPPSAAGLTGALAVETSVLVIAGEREPVVRGAGGDEFPVRLEYQCLGALGARVVVVDTRVIGHDLQTGIG